MRAFKGAIMKKSLVWMGVVAALLLQTGDALAQARARAYCLSLRFQRGTEPYDFYSLDLTGINYGINGELFPIFDTYSHASYLFLNDEWDIEDPVPGVMQLEAPTTTDANQNGWPDFFEVGQEASGTSAGVFSFFGVYSGTVQATWSRAAGSRTGTCALDLRLNMFQSLGVFTHTFDLIEYAGPLAYTPGENTVTGQANLTQTGNPDSVLVGPVAFAKLPPNRFDELELQTGVWTNASGQSLIYFAGDISRDPQWPTNYYGFLEFDDGDLDTAEPDYYDWILSIDDSADTDGDGIPNFSDDPASVEPRRPGLTLQRGTNQLLLTLSGDVGRLHHILESATLTSGNWQTNLSLTLTNDPQTVSLALPAHGPRFWRAIVP
jgi:hypothetical protein